MARKRLVELRHFEWLSQTISPFPGVLSEGFFPESEEDWQAVITLGSAHLVLPTLYKALHSKNLWGKVPQEVATALEGFFELNQLHNERLRQQMIEITRILNSLNIIPVWLKGATELLAEEWQTSPRMMLDLDFWLPDSIVHSPALAALEADGYFIPSEYSCADYSDTAGHHFLRRMKEGMPAGIEIHRDLVQASAAPLLSNKKAYGRTQWLEWEGLKIGVPSDLDRCMHSYVQCTEMNLSNLDLGQVRLMKAHDFVLRYRSLQPRDKEHFFFELQNSLWKKTAQSFMTYATQFFHVPVELHRDEYLVKRIRANYGSGFWSNPHRLAVEQNLKLFSKLMKSGKLGPPSVWLKKAKRVIYRCFVCQSDL